MGLQGGGWGLCLGVLLSSLKPYTRPNVPEEILLIDECQKQGNQLIPLGEGCGGGSQIKMSFRCIFLLDGLYFLGDN